MLIPSGLTLSNIDCARARLDWTPATTGDTQEIERYNGSIWEVIISGIASGTTFMEDIPLFPNFTNPLKVVNIYDGDRYDSDAVSATTISVSAPQNLTGYEDDGTVYLQWDLPVDNGAEEFSIIRFVDSTYSYVAYLPTTATTFQDTTVITGKTYTYQVYSECHGNAWASNTYVVTIPIPVPIPEDYYILGRGVVGGENSISRYKLKDLSDTGVESPSYGGIVESILVDGNYMYLGGRVTNKILKYHLSDLSLVAESIDVGDRINVVRRHGNFIYIGTGNISEKVIRFTLGLVFVDEIAIQHTHQILDIVFDDNYIYTCGQGNSVNADKIRKYNISDLSLVLESQFILNARAMVIDGDFIFTHNTGRLRKINKNDLTDAGQSDNLFGDIYSIVVDGDFVYASGTNSSNRRIRKFNKSDLSFVAESDVHNGVGITLLNYDNLLILGTNDTVTNIKLIKYKKSDLSIIETSNQGGWEMALQFGDVPPPPSILPDFCETKPYTISATTCGNADGSINFDENYLIFYDFVLTDIDGNAYSHPYTGLSANYYFLTATPKSSYWSFYGRDACTIDWLRIEDSDTSMGLTATSIRDVSCGGFGLSQGRIAYVFTGDTSTYTAYFYNENETLIETRTGLTSIDRIVYVPLPANFYYLRLVDEVNGCTYLTSGHKIQSISDLSVGGIKRLYITKWSADIEYNYWSQSQEDYYLSGLDANFFNSIKIKEFVDSTLPDIWYSVNVQTKKITYNQTMNKTSQGFVFEDKLVLTISDANNDKWKQLVDILTDRYILVFEDNNGLWWVMGYRYGADIDAYKLSNNEYIIDFKSISENKIVTNIDYEYVKNHIL